MAQISWLHLSDWHHQSLQKSPNRRLMLTKLMRDIKQRAKIDRSLADLDFVFFTGDISNRATTDEFSEAEAAFFGELRAIVGELPVFVFCPGNHDVDRSRVLDIPAEWATKVAALDGEDEETENIIDNINTAHFFREPFANYLKFTQKLGQEYGNGKLHYTRIVELRGKKIGIASVNSAWHSARYKLKHERVAKEIDVWDYGSLKVTESQIRACAREVEGADVKIIIMHHPINWLTEDEQVRIRNYIRANFDVMLHGHEHRPDMYTLAGGVGDLLVVPSGACYNRRVASNPRYTNSYNFCKLNSEDFSGIIFHRMWSEENDRWVPDGRYWSDGKSSFVIINKNNAEDFSGKRSMLFDVERKYLPYLYKRSVLSAKTSLKHEVVTVDGGKFVRATIRYEFTYEEGRKEDFGVTSRTSRRIWMEKSQEIRDKAYIVDEANPPISEKIVEYSDDGAPITKMKIPIDESVTKIVFQYTCLDDISGAWIWTLARFTKDIHLSITESPDLCYEYLPIGGFPRLAPRRDAVHTHQVLESRGELHLPGQGYLIQWYPKD